MSDQIKNMLIGIFVLSALGIIIFMLLFLHPYVGDEGQILRVRFTDIDKVSVGTRVTFAGKAVGEVIEIQEIEDVATKRQATHGDIYVYELSLAVDSGINVYNSDRISLRTSGLLGERSVAIDPEPLKPDETLRLVNKEILYAESSGSVEDTFKEFKEVADRFDVTLDLVSEAFKELKEENAWKNLSDSLANLKNLTEKVEDSWPNVHDTFDNLAKTSQDLRIGKGTLGRLLAKDDLYLRLTSLFNKGETLLDDMNHYGILFHLDKGWQRMRARRRNLIQKLSSPQEFRNYFNDEICEIFTSLSRVSVVLEKTDQDCILESQELTKVFAELLRRVGALEETLKLLNEEFVKCKIAETQILCGSHD